MVCSCLVRDTLTGSAASPWSSGGVAVSKAISSAYGALPVGSAATSGRREFGSGDGSGWFNLGGLAEDAYTCFWCIAVENRLMVVCKRLFATRSEAR